MPPRGLKNSRHASRFNFIVEIMVVLPFRTLVIIECLFEATNSQITTCLVVSVPASTDTFRYDSGDTNLFPRTTYTEATTWTKTYQATISAECFTLAPGQSAPTPVPYVSASCTTEIYNPETTWYYTITSGQIRNGSVHTTYTADTTSTSIWKAWSYISCQEVFDMDNPATCDSVTPLTWASLVLTIITIQLTWWVGDLPLLFKSRTSGGGIAAFLDAISWNCVRTHCPGSAAAIAAYKGMDTSEFARVYYLGMRRDDKPPEWKTWKLAISIFSDVASIVATIILLRQSVTLPQYQVNRQMQLWMFPSLPVSLFGLLLLVGEHFFPRTKRASRFLLFIICFLAIVVGVTLPLVVWRFSDSDMWFIPMIFYLVMCIPWVLVDIRIVLISAIYAWMARVYGLGTDALDHKAGGSPFCKIGTIGFGVAYMAMGGIAAVLGGFGAIWHGRRILKIRRRIGTE